MNGIVGGRGARRELFDKPEEFALSFDDLLVYEGTGDISVLEDLSFHSKDYDRNRFAARVKGFFVPPMGNMYQFVIKSDDTAELYFSHTGNPQDKVSKISRPIG